MGVMVYGSSSDQIYHNNFVNNTVEYRLEQGNGTCEWDNGFPSGGNYWSDYDGTDQDHDGIGDTPYILNALLGANETDHYPLMGTFSNFNTVSNEFVQIASNSTISAFNFNSSAICFNVSGPSGTAGFCRICIPTALITAPYKVCVNGTEIPYALLPCSNVTYSYLYINYTHSTEQVIIVPEFPAFVILPLFFTSTLLAALLFKRKRITDNRRDART